MGIKNKNTTKAFNTLTMSRGRGVTAAKTMVSQLRKAEAKLQREILAIYKKEAKNGI